MIKFGMNSNLDGNLFCPKCGGQVIKEVEEFDALKLCKYVLFVDSDEDFEYSKDEKRGKLSVH